MMPSNARENIEMVNANHRRSLERPRPQKPNYIDMITSVGACAFMVIAIWLVYVLAWACM